jgi:hypothetical protein
MDVERGRVREAVARLLAQARARPYDAQPFVGLVHACRYAGLLDASLAAQARARVADPGVPTSIGHTYFMLGWYQRALDDTDQPLDHLRSGLLAMLGRTEAALAQTLEEERRFPSGVENLYLRTMRAAIEGDATTARRGFAAFRQSGFRDPEGLFYLATMSARVGDVDEALELLEQVIAGGFTCPPPLRRHPWLEPLRTRPEFAALLADAEAACARARETYVEAEGPAILGVSGSSML